jgi:MFS family permease
MLFVTYGLLRFFCQGMMCHVAMVGMARYFDHQRGRALSLTTLGYPLGEALFPLIGFDMLSHLGLSVTWEVFAAVAAFGITPLALGLIWGYAPYLDQKETHSAQGSVTSKSVILYDWRFYGIAVGILATGFVNTGLFFQHQALLDARGWAQHVYAASFIYYALGHVIGALVCGFLVDRLRATNLMGFYLMPLLIGLVFLRMGGGSWTLDCFMVGSGMSQGASSVLIAAVWVELYGKALLGTIRSWVVSLKVLFTSLSPVLFGYLIDHQFGVNITINISLVYGLFAISLLLMVQLFGFNSTARKEVQT